MTQAELSARLIVLEVISMTSLGLYLSNSRNDPDYSKAGALLDHMRELVKESAAELPPSGQAAASKYAESLLQTVEQNLRVLRGEGGTSH